MLIPVPDDWDLVRDIIQSGNEFIAAMESMSVADNLIRNKGFDNLTE